ncbi:MAG: hypothetical protein CEE42_11960 [Promethearchaeota archaeon Loki_b31]|nr:MAG: hypothetical protein CEE42_11960 [Candidatus Lokiarchaeota archaeon Loki_b31]
MTKIIFMSAFPPMIHGIGSYTKYLVDALYKKGCECGIISFDPYACEFPIMKEKKVECEYPVLYTIPSCYDYNFNLIIDSLKNLYRYEDNYVFWIQQGDSFWRNRLKFVKMLKFFKKKKVENIIVTHHTLNFQSPETKYGFKKWQCELLENELPYIDVNTVFTNGVYKAFTKAFPEYRDKIVLIRHGVPLYPRISQENAKKEIISWLESENELNQDWQKSVEDLNSKIFEKNTITFGDIGFIDDRKLSNIIYPIIKLLQKRFPEKIIIGLYIGTLSFASLKKISYLQRLKNLHNPENNFYFFETYVPEHLFAKSLRALDIIHMWQKDCRQSGKLAHALGIGATVVGRNIEGVGETLKMCGYPALNAYEDFLNEIERIIANSESKDLMEKSASEYAKTYNWENQALKHIELAESLISGKNLPLLDGCE